MTNSTDPDEAAPMLFASVLKYVSNVRQLFAAGTCHGEWTSGFFQPCLYQCPLIFVWH